MGKKRQCEKGITTDGKAAKEVVTVSRYARRDMYKCVYNNGHKCNNSKLTECRGSHNCPYYAENWKEVKIEKVEMKLPDVVVIKRRLSESERKKYLRRHRIRSKG